MYRLIATAALALLVAGCHVPAEAEGDEASPEVIYSTCMMTCFDEVTSGTPRYITDNELDSCKCRCRPSTCGYGGAAPKGGPGGM